MREREREREKVIFLCILNINVLSVMNWFDAFAFNQFPQIYYWRWKMDFKC